MNKDLEANLPETQVCGTTESHPSAGEEALPPTIGPYRVSRKLGAGGMGIVYLAEQEEPIQRQVAVKVLSPFRDDVVHQARFDREISALATMEHPFIARVFDAGVENGRPYYAMEVVDGPPITDFAEAAGLTIAERIALFLQVCDGVQHAHQRGVIHRDLKPGNVLVSKLEGESPRPRVIDFGLARQTGVASDLSVAGAVVGTPRYMSPEQLQGLDSAVDTRTDVYALGVLLYELLVGGNPFAEKGTTSLLTLARKVIEDEAPVPSREVSRSGWSGSRTPGPHTDREVLRWSKQLEGDLDWILLKALAKEPDRRYSTVAEFAADLRRHLRDEPVLAGPPTRRYRAGKFVRRHRAAVLVSGIAGLLLILATVGTTLAWQRSRASEARARAAQQDALAAAAESQSIRRFLEDLLGSVDPSQGGRDVRLLTLLDERAGTLEEDFRGQPKVDAAVRHILGRTYAALGSYDRAERLLQNAAELRARVLGSDAPETLATRHELARVALLRGELARAAELVEAVLEDRRRVFGSASLASEESVFLQALVAYRRGESDRAYEQFEALRTRVASRGPEGAELALRAHQEMAGVLLRRGKNEQAEELYREVLAARHERHGLDHPKSLRAELRLGNALYRQRRFAEAEPIYRSVAERSAEVLGPEHPGTLLALNNLANVLDKQGQYGAAEEIYRGALATARRVVGDRHPDTLLLLNNLGNALRHAGRYREAESSYRLARAYQVEVLGPSHPETLRTISNLLKIFWALDLPLEAERLSREAVAGAPEEALAWELRAEVLERLGRQDEAQEARSRQAAVASD